MKTTWIRNATIWPSAGAPVITKGSLLIEDGRIRDVGRFRARAEVVIDAGGALIMPGLVQTHVHLCQTLFRGMAENRTLLPWLRERIWPLEAAHDAETLRVSARLACAEMIRGGTTAFLSMETVAGTQAVFEAVEETRMMGVISHCLMDESGGYPPLARPVEDALAECDVLLDRWGGHDRLRLAVAPRFALSCTAESLREAAVYARARGLLLHTHAAEQKQEIEAVERRTGYRNIEYLRRVGLSGPDVALAHGVHLLPEEIEQLAAAGTRVLHCPSANCKLGSGTAPVPEMLAAGVRVSLGADGAACNNRLDAFTEMRMAAQLQNLRLGPGALEATTVVRMATEDGADTLGWGREMGRLEPGWRANLILVDHHALHALPDVDVPAAVVYACGASDVVMTLINGEIVFEEGRLTTIDEERLADDVERAAKRILSRAELL